MSEQMVVVVTGANRGIGLAICNLILSSSQPVKLYAASRSGEDLHLKPKSSSSSISYPKLDVTRQPTIDALIQHLRNEGKHVDVLINNAGLNTHPTHTPASVKQTLDVNYRGTLHMCQATLPLLSKRGRIVNLSSVASTLSKYNPQIQSRFRNHSMTLSDLESIATDYESAVASSQESARGFSDPGQSYSVSKSCVNALTAVLARENKGLVINCCCPGWVDTDMGGIMGRPPKTPADGAKIPVKLAFGDIGGATGRYWSNDGIAEKGDGKVQEW